MPKISFIFLFCLSFSVKSQADTVIIKNTSFKIAKQKIYDDDHSYYKRVALYRIEDGKSKRLLTHITFFTTGDCNSEWVEFGDYEVNDTSFIFYTYWARAGDASSHPCGVRKQIYSVDTAGKVKLSQCLLSFHEYGMVYVNDEPFSYDSTDPASIRPFKKYYNGKILKGKEADALNDEVRKILQEPIQKNGKDWEKIAAIDGNSWGSDGFGICW